MCQIVMPYTVRYLQRHAKDSSVSVLDRRHGSNHHIKSPQNTTRVRQSNGRFP